MSINHDTDTPDEQGQYSSRSGANVNAAQREAIAVLKADCSTGAKAMTRYHTWEKYVGAELDKISALSTQLDPESIDAIKDHAIGIAANDHDLATAMAVAAENCV